MKLYATITSERAGKGRGGNEYLRIAVADRDRERIGDILVRQTSDAVGELTEVLLDFAEHVYVNGHHWLDADIAETGGKKEKAEHKHDPEDCEFSDCTFCGTTVRRCELDENLQCADCK